MSYQVLARKWRPRIFADLVGQSHVVRALSNALDAGRLHHAFLFTGTRGVGKTTIARILAKCLNCEQGVGSTPCGECSACREVDEGRFVDLIEVDAASRTKVDETRDLLENVPYAPARGRYKVYLIDEVHMFSAHSFNALLKTLEEPPPHVKFLLATTDPQKLPVTILSRCLQFNLKRLPPEHIAEHLARITAQEGVAGEPAALKLLAAAADGSVRDALSLLDQAIAFCGGAVTETDVRAMLGTIDQGRVLSLLDALAAGDGPGVMQVVAEMAEHVPDFDGVLAEIISTLQAIALTQLVPEALADGVGDRDRLAELARRMLPEDVQLYYQIAVLGRRDLPLVPDPRAGLEMTLLRMLAFRPQDAPDAASGPPQPRAGSTPAPAPAGSTPTGHGPKGAPTQVRAARDGSAPTSEPVSVSPRSTPVQAAIPRTTEDAAGWTEVVERLEISGLARELALNSVLKRRDGDAVHLVVGPGHAQLRGKTREAQLQEALSRYYGTPVRLLMEQGARETETPADLRRQRHEERRQAAVRAIVEDPNVRNLQEVLGASVMEDSVRPEES